MDRHRLVAALAILLAFIAGLQTWRVHELAETVQHYHQAMHEHVTWLDSHRRALEEDTDGRP